MEMQLLLVEDIEIARRSVVTIKLEPLDEPVEFERVIQMRGDATLGDVHGAATIAMSHHNHHGCSFSTPANNDERFFRCFYGRKRTQREKDLDLEDGCEVSIMSLFKNSEEDGFLAYDYKAGDLWELCMSIKIGTFQDEQPWKVTIDGKGAAPPEYCLQTNATSDIAEAIRSGKNTPELQAILNGVPWNPDTFDKEEANSRAAIAFAGGAGAFTESQMPAFDEKAAQLAYDKFNKSLD
jgi:hypothetical protein